LINRENHFESLVLPGEEDPCLLGVVLLVMVHPFARRRGCGVSTSGLPTVRSQLGNKPETGSAGHQSRLKSIKVMQREYKD
jgi:hypothetical protein